MQHNIMSSSFIPLMIYLIPFMVQGQLNFRVEGKIEGVVHSMIYLADHEGVKVDSVRSPDGNFAFTRNITEPLMFGINVENIAGRIQFFGVSGKINLSAEINDANKKFKNIIVTGSHEHDLYRRLVAAEKGGYTPDELQKVRELQKNNDTTALRLLKEKKMKEMENSFLEITDIISENPGRPACAYFIASARIEGGRKEMIDRFYNWYALLNNDMKKSYYGRKFLKTYESELQRFTK